MIKLSKTREQVLCLVGLFSEAFRHNLQPRKNLCISKLFPGVFWDSGSFIREVSCYTGGQSHKDHSVTALKMATFELLPVLRFFLGCKYIVCADYGCISILKGLIVCRFCSETFFFSSS